MAEQSHRTGSGAQAGSEVHPEIDMTRPSIARIYDYCVFGKDNYEVDRELIHKLVELTPEIIWTARENRAFLIRGVRYLAEECGIRQFIDHGSGLPTQQNVHQVAQEIDPSARVVYVDNDPVVLAHGRALLADNDSTTVITADMGKPEEILGNPEVQRLIDFSQPVGLLYFSVMHCLPDEADPRGVIARMVAAVPSGSYVALSQAVSDNAEAAKEFSDTIKASADWGRVRHPEEVWPFFEGLEVVEPGLGNVADWRLDLGPAVLPRPDSPEDPVAWPPAWGDDVGASITEKLLWEGGGVARKP